MYSIFGDDGTIDSKQLGPRIVTAGRDGWLYILDSKLVKIWSLDLRIALLSNKPQMEDLSNPYIQSCAVREDKLLLATSLSEIYEVSLINKEAVQDPLVCGHFDRKCEVTDLSTHPKVSDIFASDYIIIIVIIIIIIIIIHDR